MPHVVVKAAAVGSAGDLSKITGVLENLEVNIAAIGGGEGVTGNGEVGVISMIFNTESDAKVAEIQDALAGLDLGPGREALHVERLDNVEIELPNTIGALKVAADAMEIDQNRTINIRSIVMMGFTVEGAHVGLGFDPNDTADAITALTNAGITIVGHEE
jgi:hypothetical protein